MTQSPSSKSFGPSTLRGPVEGLASLTVLRRQRQHFLLRHVFACELQCLLLLHQPPAPSSLARFLSSSTPIFALTLVIGWFLTVSLLLLSHSGASVVAVENRYPCLFFFVITQIKIPMN